MPTVENWTRAYDEAPEIFDAFTAAEDPYGRVVACLLTHADLSGRSVLEIGCGTGRYTKELAPHAGAYVALERSAGMLELARRRFAGGAGTPRFLCADAAKIPLPTASVDHVVAAWVVGNLAPRKRRVVLHEIDRVLARGSGGVWLLENHWSGQFQALRGRAGDAERSRIEDLVHTAGFRLVEKIETELRFGSPATAERILGYLCGERARRRLRESPASTLTHNVVLLNRPPAVATTG